MRSRPSARRVCPQQKESKFGELGGLDQVHHANSTPDFYDSSTNSWSSRQPHGDPDFVLLYPRAHVAPNWTLFVVSPQSGDLSRSEWYDWINDVWAPIPSAQVPAGYGSDAAHANKFNTTSVLLPLRPQDGYRARVLLTNDVTPYVIDLGDPTPTYQPRSRAEAWPGSTPPVREHASAVLLPTGEVLVCGGLVNDGDDTTHVFTPELYDPVSETWSQLPSQATIPRGYHSVALLMPDGRVWTAGGSIDKKYAFHSPITDAAGNITGYNDIPDHRQLHVEIFEPDYYTATRPTITVAPAAVRTGEHFVVNTPDAAQISRAAMVRSGSMTHAFNSDQRYVELVISQKDAGRVYLEAPPSAAIAPPGMYLLFLIDQAGVPSEGVFVRVDGYCAISGVASQSGRERAGQMAAQLTAVRRFRGTQMRPTEVGRWYEAVLRRHAEELRSSISADEELLARALELIQLAADALETPSDHVLIDGDVDRIVAFIERIQAGAAKPLTDAFARIRVDAEGLRGRSLDAALQHLETQRARSVIRPGYDRRE